jgi:hypothetical protein
VLLTFPSCVAELFAENLPESSNSVDDIVSAAVQYVRAYEHSPKHKNHEIFNGGISMVDGLSAARACQIINHAWLSGDVCT